MKITPISFCGQDKFRLRIHLKYIEIKFDAMIELNVCVLTYMKF